MINNLKNSKYLKDKEKLIELLTYDDIRKIFLRHQLKKNERHALLKSEYVSYAQERIKKLKGNEKCHNMF